jgi:type I restriction enzyme S subunit
MRSESVRLQNKILSQGTKVLGISVKHLSEVLLRVPEKIEQKKIASFLILVEKLVNNIKIQKRLLEKYKKGVMQKIFSQEIRFKDNAGKNFPDWKEKKLGEILYERNEYSTKGKGYTHISLTTKGVVPKSERYDRDFLVGNDETKGYKITKLNDLCYNPANLKFGVIAINKLGSGIFSPIYVTFEIIGQNIEFVGYYLIRNAFINQARRYEQGTVYERMSVHPSDFIKVKVAFPSLPEQEKIANFLDSIDKAIELKHHQLALAEQWKKGLLQQLFV